MIRAARTDIKHSYVNQDGEGGNYLEPEVNRFAGLQDHGHSYFANSLFYGADLCDIMISGDGLIDGSSWNEEEKCQNCFVDRLSIFHSTFFRRCSKIGCVKNCFI